MFVYYAKFNINSNVDKLKKDTKKLNEILSKLAHELDTKPQNYEYIHTNEYTIRQDEVDEDGNEVKTKVIEKETYRFINTKRLKESDGEIIVGELMREKPDSIKVYNKKEHKIESTGISERVFSTTFIFDLKSEIIGFTERKGIGKKQFIVAFEALCKDILKDKAIKVILKQDPRDFVERVRELTRINQIEVEIISPNFVDKELDDIEKEAKKIGEEMDEQNITKMQYYLETSEENDEGIDLEGGYAKDTLYKYSIMSFLGYAKSTISGFIGKNAKTIKSEKDAPLVTTIKYDNRESETDFKEHVLSAIKGEATRRSIKGLKNSAKTHKESGQNE